MTRERPHRRHRRQASLASAALLVAYFVAPVEPDVDGPRLALRALATALLVLLVARLVVGQVRGQLTDAATPTSVWHLAVALVAGVLTFALADYVIAISAPDQFVNLRTRVDALYFAVATLTTVGYGDVHANGQLARMAVIAQMVFSIGVLAGGASLAVGRLTGRPPPTPPR
ncbi:potassium channel family protein [Micromonospora sp. WMMD882]|uniref:potassium channel family protein n=1 Tax=Micromonospora sp. WMMD882 TaxID=3015151 RepID=UPI00248C009D|nr:potassium channel family protein [Micromonospora sp. WMMD882]WBB81680.1 potassium channel family protein [Micromonospora sp. WMMD882]